MGVLTGHKTAGFYLVRSKGDSSLFQDFRIFFSNFSTFFFFIFKRFISLLNISRTGKYDWHADYWKLFFPYKSHRKLMEMSWR